MNLVSHEAPGFWQYTLHPVLPARYTSFEGEEHFRCFHVLMYFSIWLSGMQLPNFFAVFPNAASVFPRTRVSFDAAGYRLLLYFGLLPRCLSRRRNRCRLLTC